LKKYLDGRTAELSEPKGSFKEYVCHCETLQSSEAYQQAEAFWKEKEASLPSAPQIPVQSGKTKNRFCRLTSSVPADKWQAIQKKASQIGVTPTIVLLSAFSQILYRWNSAEEFTLNLTVNRQESFGSMFENVIGEFTGISLLPVRCGSVESFSDKCRNLQNEMAELLSMNLYDGIEVQRDTDKLFPFVFTSTLGIVRESEMPGTQTYGLTQTPNVWFDHQVWEKDGILYYNWDLLDGKFQKEMTEEMFLSYQNLLNILASKEQIWETPAQNIAVLPNLDSRFQANATEKEFPEETLLSLFMKSCKKTPDAPAVIFRNQEYTYQQCAELSAQLAETLPSEPFIAIRMKKGIQQFIACLAVLMNGSAYVPIDVKNPPERTEKILKNSNIRTVLTEEDIPLTVTGKPECKSEWESADETARNRIAYVIYTSGSTGEPKGVMITHHGAVNTILDVNERFLKGRPVRGLALSNLSFDLSVYDIFGIPASGGTVIFPEEEHIKNPEEWISLIETHQIDFWNSVPQFMEMLLLYLEQNHIPAEKIASLKTIILSGDKIALTLPDKIRNTIPGANVICMGGATEASIWSNYFLPEKTESDWLSIPYGYPLSNQQYRILHHETLDCPNFVEGELCILGEGLAVGYANDPKLTGEKFITEHHQRIYHTGDCGKYDQNGKILFLGRKDNQVKIQGYRIELGEIEASLNRMPEIKTAKAVAVNQEICAFILKASPELTEKQIQENLKKSLPNYYLPRRIYFMESFPITSNGKIDTKALVQIGTAMHSSEAIRYETETERKIAEIWSKYLDFQPSGTDDFFWCGGNSIKAISVVSDLNHEFEESHITISELYEKPTVTELGALIDSRCAGLVEGMI
ncbi:MAG: amino acid adenylation domain-containing protein, partial [Ruminococcus sp.]|nr:amino acid adenylation domain-containing protein [Ruminococcus sp.]